MTDEFGYLHFIALGVFALLCAAIFIFRKKFENPKTDKTVRCIATVTAVALEAAFHVLNGIHGNHFIENIVPLELCAISLWLSVILCLTGKKKVFEVLYFFSIAAAAAILLPNIENNLGPDRLRFYHYFAVHFYILLTVIYYCVVHRYRIKLFSMLLTAVTLLPLSLVIRFIDLAFNVNYMFLIAPPDVSTPLDNLQAGGWGYYFAMVLLAAALFLIAGLPWLIVQFRQKRRRASP